MCMSGIPMARRPVRWIVQGKEVSLGQLAERVKLDSEITEVRRIAPDVVVLSMSAQKAGELRDEFGEQLVIERDADLDI
jgi:hypothetical protein